MNKQLREVLTDAYIDYRNNYLTIACYAEHNGLLLSEAMALLNLARKVADHNHPDF